jgi:transcriptional regulator
MLYLPKHFRSDDVKIAKDLVENFGFAIMFSDSTDREEPVISHVPFLFDEQSGEKGVLYGHVAKANPHARLIKAGGKVAVVFQGPHAFISPKWYEPKADNVPTWNYAVVHIHGRARSLEFRTEMTAILKRFVHKYDPQFPLQLPPNDERDMLNEIEVFRVEIDEVHIKLKLSQNRSETDRLNVISALEKQGDENSSYIAKMMRSTLP